jgi:hypothetical protein
MPRQPVPDPLKDFAAYVLYKAPRFVAHELGIERVKPRPDAKDKRRWADPDSGFFDDAVGQATVILFQNQKKILAAEFPKSCAHSCLKQMFNRRGDYAYCGWVKSEHDDRTLRASRVEAERRAEEIKVDHDEDKVYQIQREVYQEFGGDPVIFDRIATQQMSFDGFERDDSEFNDWTAHRDLRHDPSPTPEEQVLDKIEGQQVLDLFTEFIEEQPEDDQEFIALFATDEKVTHAQVANLRREAVSTVGRRLRRIRDAFFEWSKLRQETSSSAQ